MGKKRGQSLAFTEYELPLLQALIRLGFSARVRNLYPVVEEIMRPKLEVHPEEYGKYKNGEVVWKNKIRWAREYLKRKGQISTSQHGTWSITPSGRARVAEFDSTEKDPDEGLAKLHGVQLQLAETGKDPEKAFEEIEKAQLHETGDVLNVRGIVYEPINEQGVILLFATLAHDLDFRIEAIRNSFPDALLRRKNNKGTWVSCRAEFEFRSSNFRAHKHDASQCDLIICWEHDWEACPPEVLSLKQEVRRFQR